MKKLITIVMTALMTVACIFGLTACGEKKEVVKVLDVALSSEQYGYGVKKSDTELLNKVNAFLTEKKTDIDAVFTKYLSDDADLDSFGEEIATVSTDKANELVVATELGFKPFEYKNGSKIAGIDMEIAKMLADYLGKKLVVVHMDFNAVVTSVQTKDEYDIAMAGLTINEERKAQINFSNPYCDATQTIIVKADDTTFDGLTTSEAVNEKLKTLTGDKAKCGGQKGTTSQLYINGDESFGYDGFDNLKWSAYNDASIAVTDMLNGNISFVVVDKTVAKALVKSFNN